MRLKSILAAALIVAVVVVLTGCTVPPSSMQATSPGSSAGGGSDVTVANFAFTPTSITVKAGTKVVWTSNDSVSHTVTSDSGVFASNSLAPGASFSFTFPKAGTYAYHCTFHPTMTAKVVVTP